MKRERLETALVKATVKEASTGKSKLFEKGQSGNPQGRKPGVSNKTTRLLKEALILASTAEGIDGCGKGGLVGHLRKLSRKNPGAYMRMLEKLIPLQITGKDGSPMQVEHTTRDQIVERFKERGLPLPPSLLQMPAHGSDNGKPN